MANTTKPFDAVLLISFGGPEGMDDIRPFLRNVLRGRRIPDARIDAVAKHYEMFGGVSPLRAITEKQASALAARLKSEGCDLPVFPLRQHLVGLTASVTSFCLFEQSEHEDGYPTREAKA